MCATDCGRCDDCQATDEIVTWPANTHPTLSRDGGESETNR